MTTELLQHGTCVCIGASGVLLLGQPGSGKSDLALRLIDQPGAGISGLLRHALLVADDQVLIRSKGGQLIASPPAALAGRIEIRGLGIVELTHREETALALAVRLAPARDIERMPGLEKARMELLGVSLPLVYIDPLPASAPARIRSALDWLGRR